MDIVNPKTRGRMMACIGPKDTAPELVVRRMAHSIGLRFRLHRRDLPGTPDLVFPGRKLVVFVHGCFWHRHPGCKLAAIPTTRPEFWTAKFEANVARDIRATEALQALGWEVEVVWECETRNPAVALERIRSITARSAKTD